MNPPAFIPPTPLLDDLRALPRPFWVLFAGTFINRFGTFVWPFLTIYLTRQGYSMTAAAFAVSSFGLGNFVGSALGGWLSDHIGRRHTIVAGTLCSAGLLMLLYGAASLPAVIVCTVLTGLANGTYYPAAQALLVDVVPPALRVRAYAAFRLAANAGFACGAAVGGVVANYSFFWLFAGDSLTTLLYSLIALLALPQGLSGQTRQASWSHAASHLKRDFSFHALFVSHLCAALIFAQFGSTYSLHVTRAVSDLTFGNWQLSPSALYGLLIGWNGVMIVFCELPLTGWTQRLNPRRTMALGYLLLGCGFALNAFADALPLLVIAMTLFSIGEMISMPVSHALVSRIAPESMRGRYMGLLALSWSSGAIVGPLAGFQLFQIAPWSLWLACGFLGVVGAIVILQVDIGSAPAEDPASPDCNQAALPIPAVSREAPLR